MKKLYLLMLVMLVLLTSLPAFATAGYMTVSGTKVTDSTGALVSNATIYFTPTLSNGTPTGYQINGAGQSTKSAVQAQVTSGAFTIQLADVSLTKPKYICYAATVVDNVSGLTVVDAGYGCVQPALDGTAAWCSGATCNFDSFVPNLGGQISVQTGPIGLTGPQGATSITGMSGDGAGNAALTGKFTAGTLAVSGNGSYGGTLSAGSTASFPATNTIADITALLAKVAAMPTISLSVNPLYLPPQTLTYFSDTTLADAQIAAFRTPTSVYGQGSFNQVNVASGMDAFLLQPGTYNPLGGDGLSWQNLAWRDIGLIESSAPSTFLPGGLNTRYMVRVDASNHGINTMEFQNNHWYGTNSAYAVFMNNSTSLINNSAAGIVNMGPAQDAQNSNGGIWTSTWFDNNFMYGGILLNNSGDTNLFMHNSIHPAKHGIWVSQINGAVDNNFYWNNITSGGCPIYIASGFSDTIQGNEVGVSAYYHDANSHYSGPCTTGTITVGDGSAGGVGNTLLIGNTIGADQGNVAGVTIPVPNVYIGATTTNTSLDWNTFQSPKDQPLIYNAGAATRPGKNNTVAGNAGPDQSYIAGPGSTAWENNASLLGAVPTGVLENRLRCSDDLTCPAWSSAATGSATLPVISNVAGVARPEDPDNTGTVSCFVARLNGGTTSSAQSYVTQSITGLSNPHSTVGSAWLKSNVQVTGVSVAGSGAGATITYTLAQIAMCPGGTATDGAAVGQPYSIANVTPRSCNVFGATVQGISGNTVTVAAPNTQCAAYVSGGNVVFGLDILTGINSRAAQVGWGSGAYPDNGWHRYEVFYPSTNTATTDQFSLYLIGTGTKYDTSDSVNLLFAGADNASGLWSHAKTPVGASQPLQYGAMGNGLAGVVQSKFGFQDTSLLSKTQCDINARGTITVEKGTGAAGNDQTWVCAQLDNTGTNFGWQKLVTAQSATENKLLWSGDTTNAVWAKQGVLGGAAPVVTASGTLDPLGYPTQQVVFNLSGNTTTAYSELLQTVTGLSNPNTSSQSVCVNVVSATAPGGASISTATLTIGVVSGASHTHSFPVGVWRCVSNSAVMSSTSIQWILLASSGYGTDTATVLISRPQLTIHGGVYAQTTTAAIDTTAAINLGDVSINNLTVSGTAPTWNQNTTGTAANITGIAAPANGGTGVNTSAANGFGLWTIGFYSTRSLLSADIPNNAANTTGTASNLSGTPALPNGVTATTQSPANNSTKLATTAYADAAVAAWNAPQRRGQITESLYSGTTTTGLVTLYTPAAPGQFMICGDVRTNVSATAQTQVEVLRQFTADGHVDSGVLTSATNTGVALSTSTTQWLKSAGCEIFWSDATPILAELYMSGVTGTPTYRWGVTLYQLQ